MRIEALKIPKAIQMAQDFLQAGKSLAIFTNFTDTIGLISAKLKTNCIVYGEQKIQDRNDNIDAFNSDKERIILCNIKSGGVGISLHDTHGKFPRVAIVFPSYSAQDMLQALGRINRAGGKTECLQYILFCKNTIEERMCSLIKQKIMDIGYLNDGDGHSYKITNMIEAGDDSIFNDRMDGEMNQFDRLHLQITVLNAKRDRIKGELSDVDNEINKLHQEMEKHISYFNA
jgi:superfamily II DNA or RNA helicase